MWTIFSIMAQGWDGKQSLLGAAVINPFCWPVRSSLGKWIRSMLRHDFSGQYDKWYFYSDSPQRHRKYRRYIREMAGAVSAFAKKHNAFPVLLGMERLDADACRDVREALQVPSALFLSGDHGADVMTGILRNLSLLVTSRYHAAVLSMEGACPIVAVSMDERLDGLMHELALPQYLFHVSDSHLGKQVFRALEQAADSREAVRSQIMEQLARNKAILTEMGLSLKQHLKESLCAGRNDFE